MTESRENLLYELLDGHSQSSVALKEAIYNTDAKQLFKEFCADEIGMPGLRLELFLDGCNKSKRSHVSNVHSCDAKQHDVILSDPKNSPENT